ncbi:hypothetical protein FKM82_024348 [Ascaphus truei]
MEQKYPSAFSVSAPLPLAVPPASCTRMSLSLQFSLSADGMDTLCISFSFQSVIPLVALATSPVLLVLGFPISPPCLLLTVSAVSLNL